MGTFEFLGRLPISPTILVAEILDIRALATSKAMWGDRRVTRQRGDVFHEN